MTSYLHIFVRQTRPNREQASRFLIIEPAIMNCPGLDILSLQLNWGGWDGGCVCCRSWKILAYQSAFHPAAGQSGRWRMWQVAFKDPNMLKQGKTRVRVQSRNRFRFWIWFVGNVAPVFQNQLMRMVAAFASQEPEAKETIGKVRQNQCNLWFLFRINYHQPMIAWTDIDLELKRDYLGTVTNFFGTLCLTNYSFPPSLPLTNFIPMIILSLIFFMCVIF